MPSFSMNGQDTGTCCVRAHGTGIPLAYIADSRRGDGGPSTELRARGAGCFLLEDCGSESLLLKRSFQSS